jgi:hypothetical protein
MTRTQTGIASLLSVFAFGVLIAVLLIGFGTVSMPTGVRIALDITTGGLLYFAMVCICIYGGKQKVFMKNEVSRQFVAIITSVLMIATFTMYSSTQEPPEILVVCLHIVGIWFAHFSLTYCKQKWLVTSQTA